jgi:hypothetical protein
MTGGYIIYHPRRQASMFGVVTVYHDTPIRNQDPYVWHRRFLHTYCHMTQMAPAIGDINVWVSGDTFPHFSHNMAGQPGQGARPCPPIS